MSKTRWQFSLRSLLVLMTVISAVAAFAANYPMVAIGILAATVWVLSGAIVEIVNYLSRPTVYNRHPFLATAIWLLTGTFSVFFGGVLLWGAISPSSNAPFWARILLGITTTFFGVFGVSCLRLIYISFKLPIDPENEQETKNWQDDNSGH